MLKLYFCWWFLFFNWISGFIVLEFSSFSISKFVSPLTISLQPLKRNCELVNYETLVDGLSIFIWSQRFCSFSSNFLGWKYLFFVFYCSILEFCHKLKHLNFSSFSYRDCTMCTRKWELWHRFRIFLTISFFLCLRLPLTQIHTLSCIFSWSRYSLAYHDSFFYGKDNFFKLIDHSNYDMNWTIIVAHFTLTCYPFILLDSV